jgi:triosephosphate isomerase
MMRRALVVGNWKMHGTGATVDALLAELTAKIGVADQVDIAVCPPYVFIPRAASLLASSRIAWGAQDVSEQAEGACTGEISAAMLLDFQCRYAIVGHSERRQRHGETDERVAAKFIAAQQAGLVPILCVGESLQQRESGEALATVEKQLTAVLHAAGAAAFAKAVVAYEPVWAIGTGTTATPAQAQQVHAHIRQVLAAVDSPMAQQLRILYGGSVNAGNAGELFSETDIDGALVGGASLNADEFAAIIKAGG